MDITLKKLHYGTLVEGLRKAGYGFFRDPQTQHESFVCKLGPDFYPRFHLYLKQEADAVTLSLHLDQKQASYNNTTHMHNGEYEGPHIEKEIDRILGWIMHLDNERK